MWMERGQIPALLILLARDRILYYRNVAIKAKFINADGDGGVEQTKIILYRIININSNCRNNMYKYKIIGHNRPTIASFKRKLVILQTLLCHSWIEKSSMIFKIYLWANGCETNLIQVNSNAFLHWFRFAKTFYLIANQIYTYLCEYYTKYRMDGVYSHQFLPINFILLLYGWSAIWIDFAQFTVSWSNHNLLCAPNQTIYEVLYVYTLCV